MDLGLEGKCVLVTAASRGLGFATAKAFAAEGAKVAIASRNMEALHDAIHEIKAATGNVNVHSYPVNLVDAADIRSLFGAVTADFGNVDILINNAGGPPSGGFFDFTDDDWLGAHQLTLLSAVRCIREALPAMRKRQWGRIVNFTSISMKEPLDDLILSNTYRAGVAGLSKSLATEFAPDNILINAVGPGRIATDRTVLLDEHLAQKRGISTQDARRLREANIPLGRYGSPDEFASFVVFLGSSANGYITGQSILVDGGRVRSL